MSLTTCSLARAKRYALVLVDLSVGFTDPAKSPLGTESAAVVAANQRLLLYFRNQGLPVFFTTVAYSEPLQARIFREKLPTLEVLVEGSGMETIDPRVTPLDNEPVIIKRWASGFFKTDLNEYLQQANVDGVVVTGMTTSGCVRATAVDSLQNDYRTIVVREAVGDRDEQAHHANLRDLETKYVDVLSLEQTLLWLAGDD